MKGTGKFATADQLLKAHNLARYAREAPVMTVRSDLPTFAEMAQNDLQKYIDSVAEGLGLPKGRSWGLQGVTGEIMGDDSFEPVGEEEGA